MKSLFFRKRDDTAVYWRCGVCGQDSTAMTGTLVKVGCQVLGALCAGCVDDQRRAIAALVPRSFPEVDARGIAWEGAPESQAAAR